MAKVSTSDKHSSLLYNSIGCDEKGFLRFVLESRLDESHDAAATLIRKFCPPLKSPKVVSKTLKLFLQFTTLHLLPDSRKGLIS